MAFNYGGNTGYKFEETFQSVCQSLDLSKYIVWTFGSNYDKKEGTDFVINGIRFDITLNPNKKGHIEWLDTYDLGLVGNVRFFIRFSNGTNKFAIPVIGLLVQPSTIINTRDWDDLWYLCREIGKKLDKILIAAVQSVKNYQIHQAHAA